MQAAPAIPVQVGEDTLGPRVPLVGGEAIESGGFALVLFQATQASLIVDPEVNLS